MVHRGLAAGQRYSRAFGAWCALLDRFPKDPHQPSIAERDLGNGVYGCFSVLNFGLWIDNLVSRSRRQGYARQALRGVCAAADEFGSEIYGKVEPNTPNGLPKGAPFEALMKWYASEDFHTVPVDGIVIVRRISPAFPQGQSM